jgi:carbamoyl-phosphate synthase large subunit
VSRVIHILGAGQWQVPTIKRARLLGYQVLVTDPNQERPGYAFADFVAHADLRDFDRLLDISMRYRVDGVICDTTDVGVVSAARVGERLGLAGIGYETAVRFTDKGVMRRTLAEAGVPGPRFHIVRTGAEAREVAEDLGFPVVVKPTDAQASRGVAIVLDVDSIPRAHEQAMAASAGGRVIVEEYIHGTEFTVEAVTVRGEVTTLAMSDKAHFATRPQVAKRLTYPPEAPEIVVSCVRDHNAAVIRALGLDTGITHAEYKVRDGTPYLIEIAARGGGSYLHSKITPFVSGFRVDEWYIEFAMGSTRQVSTKPGTRAANLEFLVLPEGRVKRIDGVETALAIPGVEDVLLEFREGDQLAPPADDRSRSGFILVFGSDRAEVLARTAQALSTLRIDVSPS